MCGRVNVSDNAGVRVLLEALGMRTWPTREPRFNVAPTQVLDVVRLDGELELIPMYWGVSMTLPGKNGMVTRTVQNARDDKVWTSRMWKPMIENNRVLVPVNGFYEWKRSDYKRVAAYYISPASSAAMFLAGIYKPGKGEPVTADPAKVDQARSDQAREGQAREGQAREGQIRRDSTRLEVSIITTGANEAMSRIHDRMPVILGSSNAAMAWLQESDHASLQDLLTSVDNGALQFTQVSSYVNKSSNEGPECVRPVAA